MSGRPVGISTSLTRSSGTAQSFMSRPRIAFSDDAMSTVRFSSDGPMTSSK